MHNWSGNYENKNPRLENNKRSCGRPFAPELTIRAGGEFGRTVYSQGKLNKEDYGRDHHPRCLTMWMAGAGVKPGMTYGQTDDFSYNIVKDPVHVHDFHATLLHIMGINHEQLIYKYQGRRFRLTDVSGKVINDILV